MMKPTERLVRSQTLTAELWHRLPWLLTRAVVVEWTGLGGREIDALVEAGRIRIHAGRRKRKFFKEDVGHLIGITSDK